MQDTSKLIKLEQDETLQSISLNPEEQVYEKGLLENIDTDPQLTNETNENK